MTATAEIVVIGGGVHGSSLAFHLAAAGVGHVVLLEKQHIASGPTAQSGAMIRALFNTRAYVELVVASTRMFENWDEIVGGDKGGLHSRLLKTTLKAVTQYEVSVGGVSGSFGMHHHCISLIYQ